VADHGAVRSAAVFDLAEEPQVLDAGAARDRALLRVLHLELDRAVDVRRPEPGVVERAQHGFDGRVPDRAADVLRERQLTDADDRRAVVQSNLVHHTVFQTSVSPCNNRSPAASMPRSMRSRRSAMNLIDILRGRAADPVDRDRSYLFFENERFT